MELRGGDLLCCAECILRLLQNFFRYAGVVGILDLIYKTGCLYIVYIEGSHNKIDYLSEHRLTYIHCQNIVFALQIAEGQLEAHRGRRFELQLPGLRLENRSMLMYLHKAVLLHVDQDYTF